MSGFFTEAATIEGYFIDNWDHTEIAHDNVTFDPVATVVKEYVRFSDLYAGGRQASLGNNPLFRYRGMVAIQIFVKPNTGSARYLELVDFVTAIFRARRITDVNFEVPYPVKIGNREGWYQVNVLCPYYRDEE